MRIGSFVDGTWRSDAPGGTLSSVDPATDAPVAEALLTDGRFSDGTSGLSIGHVSPEAAAGGTIALVRDGDPIRIDIPNRTIELKVSDEELAARREALGGRYAPAARDRKVSRALRAYAAMATSADKGAVRDVTLLGE